MLRSHRIRVIRYRRRLLLVGIHCDSRKTSRSRATFQIPWSDRGSRMRGIHRSPWPAAMAALLLLVQAAAAFPPSSDDRRRFVGKILDAGKELTASAKP